MKRISQIANECDVSNDVIRYLIEREKFIPYRQGIMKLDKHQEDILHHILYCEGKLTEITLESKINL